MAAITHGEALRTSTVPREPALVNRTISAFAVWWGFAFYSAIFLGLGALGGSFLALGLSQRSESVTKTAIGGVIGAAIAGYFVVKWIRRRRGAFRALAEHGAVQVAYIASIGSSMMAASLVGRGNTGDVIWVTIGGVNYRAMVRGTRPWARVGVPIGVIAIPSVSYALFLAPDDEVLLAREHTD